MREIVLDTETTGLDPKTGDRIVEIGALELINHLPTGVTFHEYLNPQRPMPREAQAIHGLGDDFLRNKPLFGDVSARLVAFLADSPLIIHNASFDIAFLNAEFARVGGPVLDLAHGVNTLDLARRKFPGAQCSLDALCKRFAVDTSARKLHGALLDSELLAEVYLELLGGRQRGLGLVAERAGSAGPDNTGWTVPVRPRPLPSRLTEAERAAHAAFIAELGEDALWRSDKEKSEGSV